MKTEQNELSDEFMSKEFEQIFNEYNSPEGQEKRRLEKIRKEIAEDKNYSL